jgi:hypothetical protein
MLLSNLLREIKLQKRQVVEEYKRIKEISTGNLKDILNIDEGSVQANMMQSGILTYYLGMTNAKNIVSSINHCSPICAQVRSQVKRLHLEIC